MGDVGRGTQSGGRAGNIGTEFQGQPSQSSQEHHAPVPGGASGGNTPPLRSQGGADGGVGRGVPAQGGSGPSGGKGGSGP